MEQKTFTLLSSMMTEMKNLRDDIKRVNNRLTSIEEKQLDIFTTTQARLNGLGRIIKEELKHD